MVWALIMQPYKRYTQQVIESFYLTMACLDTALADDKPVQVMLTIKDVTFLLCTLHKKGAWQVPLNMFIHKGDVIGFSCNGSGYVHLTGYFKDRIPLASENFKKDIAKLLIGHVDKDMLKKINEDSEFCITRFCTELAEKSLLTIDGNWLITPLLKKNKKKQKKVQDQGDEQVLKRGNTSAEDIAAKAKRVKMSSHSSAEEHGSNDDCKTPKKLHDVSNSEVMSSSLPSPLKFTTLSECESKDENKDTSQNKIQESKKKDSQMQEKTGQQPKKQDKLIGDESKGEQSNINKTNRKEQKDNEGTRTIEGKVKVRDIKVGTGDIAQNGKHVTIYYVTLLHLGSKRPKIDECVKYGFKFKLGKNRMLRGLEIGIIGMKCGGKRRITIPPKMAYGSKGSKPDVPPYSTLTYEVEVINVE